jgi:hypothetical protein
MGDYASGSLTPGRRCSHETRPSLVPALVTGLVVLACERTPTSLPLESANPQIRASASIRGYNQIVPFTTWQFIPCAAGGAGEVVDFTGSLHLLLHQVVSASGHVAYKVQQQSQSMRGIGQTTGDKYQGQWVHTNTWTYQHIPYPSEDEVVSVEHFVGPGPGNNFSVRWTFHYTANPDDIVTVDLLKESTECK